MAKCSKVSVLLEPDELARLDAYCAEQGFKKSTLIARLIRDYLDRQGVAMQPDLPLASHNSSSRDN